MPAQAYRLFEDAPADAGLVAIARLIMGRVLLRFFCLLGEGMEVSPKAVRVMHVGVMQQLLFQRSDLEPDVSNNTSGSERLSPLARFSPARENFAGNVESKLLPDREIRKQ
jgi:hypothetical protein